jgi:hypothetical protein
MEMIGFLFEIRIGGIMRIKLCIMDSCCLFRIAEHVSFYETEGVALVLRLCLFKRTYNLTRERPDILHA